MRKIIGIPRSLFYYKYIYLWDKFFKEIGMEVIVSDPTNKQILDDGVKNCVDEACLPVKVFHGHVINLIDRVDYIFIPRLTSVSKMEYICPEFGGLPDMIRHTIKKLPPIIDTEINMRRSGKGAIKAAIETGMLLGISKGAAKAAFVNALNGYKSIRSKEMQGKLPTFEVNIRAASRESGKVDENMYSDSVQAALKASFEKGASTHSEGIAVGTEVIDKADTGTHSENTPSAASKAFAETGKGTFSEAIQTASAASDKTIDNSMTTSEKIIAGDDETAITEMTEELYASVSADKPRIALIGHPYTVYDKYVSMDIINKLQKFNIDVVTIEMVCQDDINKQASRLDKPMFWNYGRNAYGSSLHLALEGNISGMIFLTSFGCGIDSFVNDFIERQLRRESQIPFINITIDEHSGEAGFNTRLEAFVDMLRWRGTYEDNIPALG